MNRSGASANCWLLCLIYVCYLLNHIACAAPDDKIPLLLLTFYQPVFYATHDQHFPSHLVGFGKHCGDAMTHKLLDHETQCLDGKIPLFALTGITFDISIILLLLFTFYQSLFYATYDRHFPSESGERDGY